MLNLKSILAASAACLAFGMAAWAEDRPALTADSVLASVNGIDITLGQMITVRDNLPPEYAALPDDVMFNGLLEQLIQQTALSQIGEGRMTKRDEIALEVQRRAYLANSLLAYTADHAVSEEAVLKAYDEKFGQTEPREYHAAHILVDSPEQAAMLRSKLDEGADFAELAKENSSDGAASQGGDLGWFALTDMVEPFAEAVAKMKEGEIAGPVQTRFGWHLIKLVETRIAEAPTIEEARDRLEGDLRQQAVEKRMSEVLENAKIERMVEGIDPAVLKDSTILGQ
ncbi:peptidylprolyl isomerase [Pseudothioclava arenosa]|uniref:Parvulin-like PPIase n=1 Tax=Pseudothioclava arenosa TaxID=1795308 RepID=A0A2A4CQK0_9RHOB|nr:peptidylprolyl isomerase [Pseudothioclava arenosa]PCD76396.1 peptidylprolyl isomerase [Pseudothioclava arenosa]